MKGKKLLSAVIAATLLVGILFAGCGQEQQTYQEGDELRHVNLSMYLIGDPPPDYGLMLEKLNALLEEEINATLEVKWLGWGEYQQRYPLLSASGEQFDLIYASETWAMYRTQAKKGAFMALNDLLPKFAPKSYAALPQAAFEQAMEDGKIYMLPYNYKEVNPHGFVVRGDLRRKYNIGEIRSLEDFGLYLDAVAKNEDGMIPYNAGSFEINFWNNYLNNESGWDGNGIPGGNSLVYEKKDPEVKLFSIADDPKLTAFANKMHDWYLKGYWSKDVLVNTTAAKDSFLNGKSGAAMLGLLNFNELYLKANETKPDWDIEWYEWVPDSPKTASKFTASGVAVGANSRNPERALMLLELLSTDERYFNLTTYGIEGVHYALTDDGKLTLPPGVTAADNGFPPDAACPWGWRQEAFYKSYEGEWPKMREVVESIRDKSLSSKTESFVFDEESTKSELAAIKSVKQQYELPLLWGVVSVDEGLPILKQKLEEAGLEKVKLEAQKQLDEHIRAK